MGRIKVLFAGLVGAMWLAVMPVSSLAQAPDVIKAEVNDERIGLADSLLLTVTVDAGSGDTGQPVLTGLDGFEFVASGSSRQVTVVNGVTTAATVYSVHLQPLRTGTLGIGAVTVTKDGRTYSTEPIAVEVVPGSLAPQPAPRAGSLLGQGFPSLQDWFDDPFNADPFALLNQMQQQGLLGDGLPATRQGPPLDPALIPAELAGQDFYVDAAVDNPVPFQGEQVVYTVRLFQVVDTFGQIGYDAPAFTGLWATGEPEQVARSAQAGGRPYRVTELSQVLFPAVVGEVTIDPATFTIPGGFGSRGGAVSGRPLTLEVRPLPPGAPAGFAGAVGQFNISAEVDRTEAAVGDTVTQVVTLAGRGNIEALPDPAWPAGPEWRAFDSDATAEFRVDDEGHLAGSRTFRRLLVPTRDGELILPAVTYSYFDPATAGYHTVSTEAVAVVVVPGGSGDGRTEVAPAATSTSAEPGFVSDSLRPFQSSSSLQRSGPPLAAQGGYWLLWSVPVVFLIGQWGWQKRRRRLAASAPARRSRAAAAQARSALQAIAHAPDRSEEAAGRILVDYLTDKLDSPVVGMTRAALADLLRARNMDPALVARVDDCLARAEAGRYGLRQDAPAAANLVSDVGELIDRLEEAISPRTGGNRWAWARWQLPADLGNRASS